MPPKTKPSTELPDYLDDPHSLYYSSVFNPDNFDLIPLRADLFTKADRDRVEEDAEPEVRLPPKTNLITLRAMYQTFLKPEAFLAFCSGEALAKATLDHLMQQKTAGILSNTALSDDQKAELSRIRTEAADGVMRVRRDEKFRSQFLGEFDPLTFDANIHRRRIKAQHAADQKFICEMRIPVPADIEARLAPHIAAAALALENATFKIHPFEIFCENNALLAVNSNLLELSHNWAQLLFPTDDIDESSAFSPTVLLSAVDRYQISQHPELQNTLLFNFAIAMKFYGFDFSATENGENYNIKLTKPRNAAQIARWQQPNFAHNYRRITRILRSLQLAGLGNIAVLFLNALETMRDDRNFMPADQPKIVHKIYQYWREAVRDVPVIGEMELPGVNLDNIKVACAAVTVDLDVYNRYITNELRRANPASRPLCLVKQTVCQNLLVAAKDTVALAAPNLSDADVYKIWTENFHKLAAMAQGILQVGGDLTKSFFSRKMKGLALGILKKRDALYPRSEAAAADTDTGSFSAYPPI